MIERLLENWLDSINEKGYQAPFCQMLLGRGYILLHSTRHCALEYGKDVIAYDPQGVLCAFQLKGNPGSRLTLAQFLEIQAQLVQLATQPVILAGKKIQKHKCFLVTNGEVDETVVRAIDDLNRGFAESGTLSYPIEVITRGQILAWAIEYGTSLWPFEVKDANALLTLLTDNGDGPVPANLLHNLVAPILKLHRDKDNFKNAAQLKRAITSAAILISIGISRFVTKTNYAVVTKAWVQFAVYVIGACEKSGYSYKKNGKPTVDLAVKEIMRNLYLLCNEIQENKYLVEGTPLVDFLVHRWRRTLLLGLMSLYWFWGDHQNILPDEQRKFLEDEFLKIRQGDISIWGEGVIPQILIFAWYLRKNGATNIGDDILVSIVSSILEHNTKKGGMGLPNPYYNFDDVLAQQLSVGIKHQEGPMSGDSYALTSFYAESLLNLLVRANLKQTCKRLWPKLTMLSLKYFQPAEEWMFCLFNSESGEELSVQPLLTKNWTDLVEESRSIYCDIPDPLKDDFHLLMAFLLYFPYRGKPNVIRFLGHKFNDCWFIPDPLS